MAIIKVAKGGKTLSQAINYAGKENKTIGKDVDDDKEKAFEQMKITKEIYNKTDGRQYKHYIQSFAVGEVDVAKAQKIGLELAESKFKGYEVFIGTHTDRGHIHNHMIVNSVNFENGKKFNVPKNFLDELKKSCNEICKSYGLEIPEKKELSGEVRAYSQEKYQMLKKAFEGKERSYILDFAKDTRKIKSVSKSRSEFIKNMSSLGYKTNWTEERKHVTFEKDGNKVRLSNLEKTFTDKTFSKEGLENEFKRNFEREQSTRATDNGINRTTERNEEIKRTDEVVHIGSDGQTSDHQTNDRQRVNPNTDDNKNRNGNSEEYEPRSTTSNDFDFEEAKRNIEREQRENAKSFGEFKKRDDRKQSDDSRGTREDREHSSKEHDGLDRENESIPKKRKTRHIEHDFER